MLVIYGFVFVALSILPGSVVAVILQSQVPIAVFLSYSFLQERVSFKQSLGIVFAIMGILLIYGIPELSAVGLFLGLLGSFCWGITQILIKQTLHNASPYCIEQKLAVDDLIFVAENNKKIIGACIAGYDGHRGWLYAVAVSQSQRCKGTGTNYEFLDPIDTWPLSVHHIFHKFWTV